MPNRGGCKKALFILLPVLSVFVLEAAAWAAASSVSANASPAIAVPEVAAPSASRGAAGAPPLVLDELIGEALEHNPGLAAYKFKAEADERRIPQQKSLPDPMVSVGYQNEGWDRYSFGDRQMSMWNFAASQTFPYPGKLGLKGKVAESRAASDMESWEAMRLRVVRQVKDLYYDLFYYYKGLDIIAARRGLFTQMENAALARYSSGLAPQEEVILAQTEKYTLLEKQQTLDQKIKAAEAKLNSVLGRPVAGPLGKPGQTEYVLDAGTSAPLIQAALSNSPDIRADAEMVEGARAGVELAKKQYYPDFTVTGQVSKRAGDFMDIWSLTTAVNVPLFYRTKQREGVKEAEALQRAAEANLEAARLSLSSEIENYFAIQQTAGNLMKLYREGLVPKTYQDFEAALSGYVTGKVPALTAIDRLKTLLDFEFRYWEQFVERQKALASVEAITGKTGWIRLRAANGPGGI
ncbi:MAG: TolC family protein [Nitrospiraceae bacterium]|nr:TolC family protein [Nitrospiraceae bacterium]